MIKAIIFDFGRVIFKTNWDGVNQDFIKKYGKGILVQNNEELGKVYHKTNAGYGSAKPFLEHIFPDKNINKIIEFYKKSYIKNKILNKELLKLIKVLKKKYPLYGFTDTNNEHFEANTKAGIFKDFKRIFTSFEFKGKKAEGDIFHQLVKKINIPPEELLFIDDYLPNIEKAREAGLKAIQYTDFPEISNLKKELERVLR